MKKLFFIIIAFISIFFAGQMAFASDTADKMCEDTAGSCSALFQSTERVLQSATVELVCIKFTQVQKGPVVLTLYGEDNIIRRLDKIAGANDEFCIGKQWLSNKNVVRVELCNNVRTRTIWRPLIDEIVETELTRAPVPLFEN